MTTTRNSSLVHFERRWALKVKFSNDWEFLGRRCWPMDSIIEIEQDVMGDVPTFQTRAKARHAKTLLTSYRKDARVVEVEVRIGVQQ